MTRPTLISIAALLLLTYVAPAARAQGVAAAEALFQEGQAALERGDLNAACSKLRESDRLDPANGTKLNLADCEEKRGHLASAWELYRKLADSLPPGDERLPYAQERAQSLAPRVPRLTLQLAADAPPDTRASLGAVVFTSASFGTALPLDPDSYDVVVSGAGSTRSFRVALAAGESKTLEITPFAAAQPAAAAATTTAPSPTGSADRGDRRDTRMLGYILGGVGVVGLGVGTISGVIGLKHQATGDENCDDTRRVCNQQGIDANDKARSMRPISLAGFALGVAGLGAGAYFVLTSSPDDRVALGGRVGAEVAALDVTARW